MTPIPQKLIDESFEKYCIDRYTVILHDMAHLFTVKELETMLEHAREHEQLRKEVL